MKLSLPEFWVEALWDEDSEVYYSKSNIKGLHIEAESLGVFEEAMFDIAPEMIFENHIKAIFEEQGMVCEINGSKMRVSKKKSASKIPENIPFIFKGAASRRVNIAMA